MSDECRWKLGDIVYPAYTPARAGKVIAIRDNGYHPDGHRKRATVTIKLANGFTYDHGELALNDYRELVEHHRRKLQNHERKLRELEDIE